MRQKRRKKEEGERMGGRKTEEERKGRGRGIKTDETQEKAKLTLAGRRMPVNKKIDA